MSDLRTLFITRRDAIKAAMAAGGFAAIGLGPAGKALAQDADPVSGGTLIYGLSTDPPNLDTHVGSGYAAATVKEQVYDSLVRINENFEFLPGLALSWEVSEDRLTWTFALRSGVKWHDGSDFTADDVKYTIERIKNPEGTFSAKNELRYVDSVEVIDPLTVAFHLTQPDEMLLAVLQDNLCHIVSKAVGESGADLAVTLIGTGPFKYVGREAGVSLTFEKNPDYWEEGLPYLDGIVFQPIADETARVQALQSGQVQLIDYVPQISHADLEASEDFKLYYDVLFTQMWMMINHTEAPFNDPLVRQAAAYTIDREAILQAVFFGRGKALTGGIIPPMLGGTDELDGTYTRDLDKAAALLAEGGYTDKIDITLTVTSTYAFHTRTAEVVASTMNEGGFNVELELLEWATLLDRNNNGPYTALIQGGGFPYPHVAAVGSVVAGGAAAIVASGYVDPEMEEMVNDARQTSEPDALGALAKSIDERILDKLPRYFLIGRAQAEASTAALNGYYHIPGGQYSGVTIRGAWLETN